MSRLLLFFSSISSSHSNFRSWAPFYLLRLNEEVFLRFILESFGCHVHRLFPLSVSCNIKLYSKLGSRGTTFSSLLLMSASLLLYGLNYFIPDHHKGLFIGCNIVTKLVEGGGSGVATSALISLVANNYPN